MSNRGGAVVAALSVVCLALPAYAGAAIRVDDVDMAEGNSHTTVVLNYRDDVATPPEAWRCVDFRTVDGKATSVISGPGAAGPGYFDYEAKSGTACLEPGATEGTIEITVRGDLDGEFDENFRVLLTNGRASADPPDTTPAPPTTPYPIAAGQSTITLRNDDGPPHGVETFAVTYNRGSGTTGSLSGTFTCEDRTFPLEGCPEGSQPPFTLNLERGGQLLDTASGGNQLRLEERPRVGDVARFIVSGVARASTTFDGKPSLDLPCEAVGRSVAHGQVTSGHVLTIGTTAAVSRTGDNFTLTFPRPLTLGLGVILNSRGEQAISPFQNITVVSRALATVCGSGLPPCLFFQAGASPGTQSSRLAVAAAQVARAFHKAGIRALLASRVELSILACAQGRIEARLVRAGGKGGSVVVARGDRTVDLGAHQRISVPWRPTSAGSRLLRRTRRIVVRVDVRQVDSNGRALKRSQRVTLTWSGGR